MTMRKKPKKLRVRSSHFVEHIADEASMDPRDVRYVLELFSDMIVGHLSLRDEVHIDGVGTLGVFVQDGLTREVDLTTFKGKKRARVPVGRICKVSFRKAHRLKEALNGSAR